MEKFLKGKKKCYKIPVKKYKKSNQMLRFLDFSWLIPLIAKRLMFGKVSIIASIIDK
jgi:hypothetical protein